MGINDGKFTYEQDAMTDQEVIAWKMDEMNSRITSLQTQQMFNNINLSSGGGRLIALGYVLIYSPSHIREDLDL